MITAAILVGALIAGQRPEARPASTAADQVSLRDGSTILGQVTSVTAGPRGTVEVMVRREWAEKHLMGGTQRWDKAVLTASKKAARQRRERLLNWRRDRMANAPADDPILAWIGRELDRLGDPERLSRTALIPVKIPRGEVRGLTRQPRGTARLLQLGWLCNLPEVETLSLDDLKDALEGRGYNLSSEQTPSLAELLPLGPETEETWIARRGATEVTVDPDLRYLRYQDMVLPDSKGGAVLSGLNLGGALSELAKLLDPNPQPRNEPLAPSLEKVSARGRAGAVVTRLEIAPDLAQVTVETSFWTRAPGGRWMPQIARSSTVRPEELAPEAGRNLAADPQVQTAFQIVEALGLGSVSQELKQRSLGIGAATQKALGTARTALDEDLIALLLPVMGPVHEEPPVARKP